MSPRSENISSWHLKQTPCVCVICKYILLWYVLDGTKGRFSFYFSQMRIFTHFCQKSDCFKYERSLKELPKCMTKSKRFSKLRWRADCIYFPIIDHPFLFSVMLNPYLLRGVIRASDTGFCITRPLAVRFTWSKAYQWWSMVLWMCYESFGKKIKC